MKSVWYLVCPIAAIGIGKGTGEEKTIEKFKIYVHRCKKGAEKQFGVRTATEL